jgi:crotonobetainyl-CoA:carnitine CoA-transferase CaiB-like acyl-CoA transferase
VRRLDALYEDPQVQANGLVQTVQQDGVGAVRLLGSPFKFDGAASASLRGAPSLGEHTADVLGALQETRT